jgi:hypothetical protein
MTKSSKAVAPDSITSVSRSDAAVPMRFLKVFSTGVMEQEHVCDSVASK